MITGFTDRIRIDRRPTAAHDTVTGFPHYFPLSMLPDTFWDAMAVSAVIRVTDGIDNEFPYHLAEIDVINKTGALFFKADKDAEVHAFWIQFGTTTEANHVAGPYSPPNVWSAFNTAILLNEDLSLGQVVNYVDESLGTPYSNDDQFFQVPSLLEMKANNFTVQNQHVVEFGPGTFDVQFTPMTILALYKPTEPLQDPFHILGNWNLDFGFRAFRVVVTPNQFGLEMGQGEDPVNENFTGFNPPSYGNWHLAAIRYDFDMNVVEIDINGVNKALGSAQAFPIWDAESPIRTVGGFYGDSSGVNISMCLSYNGSLNKGQRDQFFANWASPSTFWTVVSGHGSTVCFSSDMEKILCFSSHIK